MIDKTDFIIKTNAYKNGKTIKQKYFRAYCDNCQSDRNIYQTAADNRKRKLCRSCCAKARIAKYGNPMQGQHHKDLEKFRPTYSNVNYEDYKIKSNTQGKNKRLYRMTCKECGKDRGYLTHGEAKRSCLECHTKKCTKKSKIQKRLYGCIKANINAKFKQRNLLKLAGILRYLPYTLEELKRHLESQFEPWMTWENHGVYNVNSQLNPNLRTWQIDHILPDSSFSYTSVHDEGFKLSWALNNLRPLESLTNIIKSNH